MIGVRAFYKFGADADESTGWGESHYLPGAASGDLAAEQTKAGHLGDLRKELLGPGFFLQSITISDLNDNRRYAETSYTKAGGTSSVFGGNNNGEFADAALMVTKRDVTCKNHGRLFMRGLPGLSIGPGGTFAPGTGFGTAYDNFKAELLNGWGFIAKSAALPGRQMNIVGIAANGNGTITYTVANVPGLLAPSLVGKIKILVSGVQGAVQANGSNVVTWDGAVGFTTTKRVSIFPYVQGGVMTVSLPGIVLINDLIKERIVGRKAGASFFRLRGRAKARAR